MSLLSAQVAAGMLSGAVAAGVFNPTDLVKVRMQSDPDGGRYRSLLGAFRQIVELVQGTGCQSCECHLNVTEFYNFFFNTKVYILLLFYTSHN